MKVMDAARRGFELAAQSLTNVILVMFVFNLAGNMVTIPFTPLPTTGTPPLPPSAMLILLGVILFLIGMFVHAGAVPSIRDLIKEGKVELSRFAGYGGKFYLRFVGFALLVGLVVFLGALLAILVVAVSAPIGNTVVTIILAIIALIIGGLAGYAVLLFSFSPYAAVAADCGFFEAVKNSVAFVRKNLLRVVGLGLILLLIALGVGLVLSIIFAVLAFAVKGRIYQIVVGIASSLVNSFLSVVIIGSILSYYLALTRGRQSTDATQSSNLQ